MSRNLLILGAGQYGMVAKNIAESLQCFEKISFLDDHNPIAVGGLSDYMHFSKAYSSAIVAIGAPELRLMLLQKLTEAGFEVISLISPMTSISPSARIGEGTIVEPMAVVQSNATVGRGCLLCAGTVVKHDVCVGEGCYLDCNVVVMSGAIVPPRTKVEACCVYRS